MVCSLIKFSRVSSTIHIPLDVKINIENSDHPQNRTRYHTCQAWGKEEEKPLIPGPVWYVEKLILAQLLLQTSTSCNRKCSMKFPN
jgi:hypothetical protein